MKKIIVLLLLSLQALFLTNCSSDWIGAEESKQKLEGERVTVFRVEPKLFSDNGMENITFHIPEQEANYNWLESDSSQRYKPDNIKLNSNFEKKLEVKLGNFISNIDIVSGPIYYGSNIYFLDKSSKLHGFDLNSEKEVLKIDLKAEKDKTEIIGGGISLSDDIIYASYASSNIIAININNGEIKWRSELGNIVRSMPVPYLDKVFALTIDNRLYALDKSTGAIEWSHEGIYESLGIFGDAAPNFAEGAILAPQSSGEMYAIDALTGREYWGINLAFNKTSGTSFFISDIDIPPVIKGNKIYIAGNSGLLICTDLHSGNLNWKTEAKNIKYIWVAGNFVFLSTSKNEIAAIDKLTGKIKWVKNLSDYEDFKKDEKKLAIFGPVLAGDNLLFTTSNGYLLAISPYDGQLHKKIEIGTNISFPPVVVAEKIYVINNNGKITILE